MLQVDLKYTVTFYSMYVRCKCKYHCRLILLCTYFRLNDQTVWRQSVSDNQSVTDSPRQKKLGNGFTTADRMCDGHNDWSSAPTRWLIDWYYLIHSETIRAKIIQSHFATIGSKIIRFATSNDKKNTTTIRYFYSGRWIRGECGQGLDSHNSKDNEHSTKHNDQVIKQWQDTPFAADWWRRTEGMCHCASMCLSLLCCGCCL